MEQRKLKLLVVIGLLLLMALPDLVLADPNDPNTWDDAKLIARTMREYQARRIYIYGPNYPLSWPPSEGCPFYFAPRYPYDEYYQYKISQDPNAAVELVADIVEKFYNWIPIRPGRLYGKFPYAPERWFVRIQCWEPDGTYLEPDPNGRYDFPGIPLDPDYVTLTNYREVLETIYKTLTENFKVVTVTGSAIDCSEKLVYGTADKGEGESCYDAKQDANSNWEEEVWEYYSGGRPEVKDWTGKNETENQYQVRETKENRND